jgi:hypothetical protein
MPRFHLILAFLLTLAVTAPAQRPNRRGERPAASEEESRPRLGPPKRLLTSAYKWQSQSGAWKADPDAGTATCTSDGTLAEYAATNGIALPGHWLAVRAQLTGPTAKAGLWLAGIRDTKGDPLRIAFDSAAGGLVGGRGEPIAALPNDAFTKSIEVVLNFAPDKVTVHHAGQQLAEIAVTFDEQQATPSLFVERGEAAFTDLLLSGDPVPVAPKPAPPANVIPLSPPVAKAPVPAPPAVSPSPLPPAPVPPPAAATAVTWTFDFTPEKLTALKSGWNDYFGVHFETAAGPWKMVRQFDGPEFGIPGQGRHTGDVKQFPGPFAQVPVDLSLADFRDWKRKDARNLDENLAALVRDDRQALWIAPWAGPIQKLEQDHIYALMKLTYGANPGAEGRLFFQWGDSLNDAHYGTTTSARRIYSAPSGSTRLGRGPNTPGDLVACAENYLAPAIEAVRFASSEIYQDPRRIPIVAGSCAAAADMENRAWYGQLFDRVLEGTSAPSLKGRRLASVVDYLAVNYPLHEAGNDAPLQELWDRFCAVPPNAKPSADDNETRPRGLWVTEEYGPAYRGPGTLLTRAARFLNWTARNQLDAQQTRLLWYISTKQRGGEETMDAVRTLGQSFGAGALRLSVEDLGDSRLTRIAAGDGRMLIVHQPWVIRRGRRPTPVGDIALTVTEAQAARPWVARLYQDISRRPPPEGAAFPVRREANRLILTVSATMQEPWAVLVETP